MTAVPSTRDGDLVGLSACRVTGGARIFLGLATERTVALGALDAERVSVLLEAADAAAFFTHAELGVGPIRPDARV